MQIIIETRTDDANVESRTDERCKRCKSDGRTMQTCRHLAYAEQALCDVAPTGEINVMNDA